MQTNRITQMELIQKEALELFKKKNADYTNRFDTFDTMSVMIHTSDVIDRFLNIHYTNKSLVNDKTLRNTLIDLQNYTGLAIMLLDEKNDIRNNKNDTTIDVIEENKEYFIDPNMRIY